jgi:hypothetical protein
MDTEFINVYIQKQKTFIEELVAKNLILETKLTIADKIAGELGSKVSTLEGQLSKALEAVETKKSSRSTSNT